MKNKWEMGSSFDACSSQVLSITQNKFFFSTSQLYLCGRSALLDLIVHQKKTNNLSEIYIPSYYCHDITRALETILIVNFYKCDPLTNIDLSDFPINAAIIIVEYFANKAKVSAAKSNSLIILDKTHDPLSDYKYNFTIDYIFGSLRKVFPISDGGFLRPKLDSLQSSINDSEIPKQVLEAQKAMQLKSLYLKGENVEKNIFLNKFHYFERFLDLNNDIYPISELSYKRILSIDYEKIIALKRRNIEHINRYYSNNCKFKIFENKCYFSILVRPIDISYLKAAFISKKVYPIILWPNYEGDYDLIDGLILLSMHVDFRYTIQDIEILIQKINEVFHEF